MFTSKSSTLLLITPDSHISSAIRTYLNQHDKLPVSLFVETDPDTALRKTLPAIRCDAIAVDFANGNMDRAIKFAKVVRQHYPTMPIVALIADGEETSMIEALAHGIHECLPIEDAASDRLAKALDFAAARATSTVKDNAERQFLNALLENYPDFIYFKDRDGRFIRVSQSLAKAVGVGSYKAMIGCTDFDFFEEEHARKAYQDEQQVMHSREGVIGELEEIVLPDGAIRWVSTTRVPLIDSADNVIGTMGISREVDDLVRTRQALQREKLFLKTILDAFKDSIFVKDAEGRYLLSNRTHCRSVGAKDPAEIIGKTVFDFFPKEFAEPFHAYDMELLRSGEVVMEKEEQRTLADGSVGWFATSKIPFRNPQTGELGIVGISREITKVKELEQRLAAQ
jgi:PAS domain S-box-containing protein